MVDDAAGDRGTQVDGTSEFEPNVGPGGRALRELRLKRGYPPAADAERAAPRYICVRSFVPEFDFSDVVLTQIS